MSCFTQEQLNKISNLVREVEKLNDTEKLLLYLQLPCGRTELPESEYHNTDDNRSRRSRGDSYLLMTVTTNLKHRCKIQEPSRRQWHPQAARGHILKKIRPGDHSDLHVDPEPSRGGPERVATQAGGLRRVSCLLPGQPLRASLRGRLWQGDETRVALYQAASLGPARELALLLQWTEEEV